MFQKILLAFLFISFSILFADDIHNQGITHSNKSNEVYITIDMCPASSGGLNIALFKALSTLAQQKKQTIPVAIAVSGKWIKKYPEHIAYLKNLEQQKIISITWVNHGYKHFYNPTLPDENNFMLHNKAEAMDEIIKNQKLMEDNGLTPSKFFRFPGLVSDIELLELLRKNHLVPLGASAWVAKTHGKFKGGDVILVHGNGHEPLGVKYFIKAVEDGDFNKYKVSPITELD